MNLTQEELNEQLSTNQQLFTELWEAGDNHEISREIYHNIIFTSLKDKDDYKDFALREWFQLEHDFFDEEDEIYDLEIMQLTAIIPDKMNQITLHLASEAKNYNGLYDGWYTSIETL